MSYESEGSGNVSFDEMNGTGSAVYNEARVLQEFEKTERLLVQKVDQYSRSHADLEQLYLESPSEEKQVEAEERFSGLERRLALTIAKHINLGDLRARRYRAGEEVTSDDVLEAIYKRNKKIDDMEFIVRLARTHARKRALNNARLRGAVDRDLAAMHTSGQGMSPMEVADAK